MVTVYIMIIIYSKIIHPGIIAGTNVKRTPYNNYGRSSPGSCEDIYRAPLSMQALAAVPHHALWSRISHGSSALDHHVGSPGWEADLQIAEVLSEGS